MFSPYQSAPGQYLGVFNRGTEPFGYTVTPAVGWLTAEPASGRIERQRRIAVSVDWSQAPEGATEVPLTVTGPDGASVTVLAVEDNPGLPRSELAGFIEAGGYVSMEAEHYAKAVRRGGVGWHRLPDIGRTAGGMTPFPVTATPVTPGGGSPRLEYRMTLTTKGTVRVLAYLSPRNNVLPSDGLKYAVSIDDDRPQTVNMTTATGADDAAMNAQWERNTSDNINVTTTHTINAPGTHVLKLWRVDPTMVVPKLVVETGGLRPSYLGPRRACAADAERAAEDAENRPGAVPRGGRTISAHKQQNSRVFQLGVILG